MIEIEDGLAQSNPRAEFLSAHRVDLDLWSVIPFNLGIATAPLYDHLPNWEITWIIGTIFLTNWLWMRISRPLIEDRIGVLRLSPFAHHSFGKQRRRLTWRVCMALLGCVAVVAFLNRGRHFYHGHGWIENTSGIWLCMLLVYCLVRALDHSNYHPRRLWYGIASVVLGIAFYFDATWPGSFAFNLVLVGATSIALGLLDLGLLFHFAATPVTQDGEGGDRRHVDGQEDHA